MQRRQSAICRGDAADGQLLDDSTVGARRGDFCVDSTWPHQKIDPRFSSRPRGRQRRVAARARTGRHPARSLGVESSHDRRPTCCALFESARNVCMADVCLTAPAVLSPLSPNESRKRRHGSSGVQGTWLKRHRTGHAEAGSRGGSCTFADFPSTFARRRSSRASSTSSRPRWRRCDRARSPVPRGSLKTELLPAPRALVPPTPFSAIAPRPRAATAHVPLRTYPTSWRRAVTSTTPYAS